jgi:biopolymer transport protein ExbB/TolQ
MRGLLSIAQTAMWVGILGAVAGISDALQRAYGTNRSVMEALSDGIWAALIPMAWGLLVGVFASWGYRLLAREGVETRVARRTDFVERASLRAVRTEYLELRRGIGTLASIAHTALWLGAIGAVRLTIGSFKGIAGSKNYIGFPATQFSDLAEALTFTALGLLVGLLAWWCHHSLATQIESLETEMHAAALDIANSCSIIKV